jgi:hypothetical protein
MHIEAQGMLNDNSGVRELSPANEKRPDTFASGRLLDLARPAGSMTVGFKI